MRIAILANTYGSLSEAFVSRETTALAARGHDVRVFVGGDHGSPAGAPVTLPVEPWTDDAIKAWAPEVLYAQMGLAAHQRATEHGQRTNTPYAMRVWQGYDSYARPSPEFYRQASAHRLCLGVIVEDEFNREHARTKMAVQPDRIHVVHNSIDTDIFTPRTTPRDPAAPVRILAIGRYVPKKGLIHLVNAFNRLRAELGERVELVFAGYGPEEPRLRAVAGPGVTFLGVWPQDRTQELFQTADIFAAPCVQMSDGDADGIPTTVLEAMSCGVPVVVSNLLSAREYVYAGGVSKDRGFMVPPGDQRALATVLGVLMDWVPRETLGANARAFAVAHLDIRQNIQRIEAVLQHGSRHRRWEDGMHAIVEARKNRPPALSAHYDTIIEQALAFWDISGDVLDVGCGNGWMRNKLGDRVTSYLGVEAEAMFWAPYILVGTAEDLPSDAESFDSVVCNSVLQHVERPEKVLAEIHRVLKRGGKLALSVNVDDPNPIFLWWWTPLEALALLKRAGFNVAGFKVLAQRHLYVNAVKP